MGESQANLEDMAAFAGRLLRVSGLSVHASDQLDAGLMIVGPRLIVISDSFLSAHDNATVAFALYREIAQLYAVEKYVARRSLANHDLEHVADWIGGWLCGRGSVELGEPLPAAMRNAIDDALSESLPAALAGSPFALRVAITLRQVSPGRPVGERLAVVAGGIAAGMSRRPPIY